MQVKIPDKDIPDFLAMEPEDQEYFLEFITSVKRVFDTANQMNERTKKEVLLDPANTILHKYGHKAVNVEDYDDNNFLWTLGIAEQD